MIKVTSPTRVDLAGGTLDMWPLSAFLGPCATVNVAIDIYTEVTLEPSLGPQIVLKSHDLNQSIQFQSIEELYQCQDRTWALLKEVILFFMASSEQPNCNPTPEARRGFVLTTQSGSPVGGGLGGSSSLVVSLIKAFQKWLNLYPQFTVHDWVRVAHNIEARVLRTPTGTQDYYPAFQGGINCIRYQDTGIELKTFSLSECSLFSSYFLVDTGKSHHSGLNNFDVLTRTVQGDSRVWTALKSIQANAESLAYALSLRPHALSWSQIFEQEYGARVQLSPTFSSPEIEELRQISLGFKTGDLGIKILGAGGGGCVLVWGNSELPISAMKEQCQARNFRVIPIQFVDVL